MGNTFDWGFERLFGGEGIEAKLKALTGGAAVLQYGHLVGRGVDHQTVDQAHHELHLLLEVLQHTSRRIQHEENVGGASWIILSYIEMLLLKYQYCIKPPAVQLIFLLNQRLLNIICIFCKLLS